MESRPSRWDALSDGPSPSSSCSSSRRRPKKLPSKKKLYNSNCGGHCRPEEREIQRGATTISPHYAQSDSGGNWRRRAAANDDGKNNCLPPNVSAEEEKVRGALKQLQIAIGSFLGEDEGNVDSKEGGNCVHHSIEQLSTSLFDVSPEEKSTKILPNISNAVIWEVAYVLLRQLQLLSQSKGSKNTCRQLLKSIASVTLVCLQSLINNQQQLLLQEGRPTRTKAVTDVRLCESASILLDTFGCPLFNDDDDAANQSEIILCKETLLSCLAKILAISTMTSQKNTRESRGPLFPWGAEKTVNLVVKQTALPFLELLEKGSFSAMECLYLLLQDLNWDSSSAVVAHDPKLSKHAAAILAPLVVDVSPDGRENQRINPLRSRTLSAISAFWGWSYELTQCGEQSSIESKDPIMVSCQCMTAALNALSALRKRKVQDNQSANVCEIDVATIARQLHSMLQNDGLRSFRPNFFNLLSLLCTAYPSPSAGQWHLFLEKSGVNASPLLSILEDASSALGHKKAEDEAVSASLPYALHAMSEMISIMPFTLWNSGGGATRSSRRKSGGNLSSRVRNAVLNVINCIFDLMTAVKYSISGEWLSNKSYPPLMEDVMVQISQVAGKLCTNIPFNGENSGLRQPASRLVQCAADIYVQSAKLIVMESELDHTISYKAMSSFGAVIRESLGVDSAPAEKWLASASSYEFIGLLLTDACWKCPSSKDRMEMLSFVAKRSPLTLAREPFNLASFCEVCAVQCRSENDADSRILGLKLIESFILGRKESLTQCSSNSMVMSVVPETFCPLLHVALEDHSADVRACAVSAFGSLLKHDWVALLLPPNVDRIDWTYLESILRLCTANEETSANVRGCSCKAVGLVATTCIGGMPSGEDEDCIQFSFDFVLSFTCKICEVMLNALTDKNASVRSMALFAAGNTGLALKENATENSTPPHPSLKCLFLSVCACLADKDEKVVANAIRSISHLAYFVYHPKHVSEEDNASAPLEVYITLLRELSVKIEFALDDAAGETVGELVQTWKQRNGAKKHAWGSCTTLGVLLSFTNLHPHIDDSLIEAALSSMFRCLQLSNVLHEKIAAAAINSLVGLPVPLWQHLSSCRCDSIGRGLAACFGFLHEQQRSKTKLSHHNDVEALASLLLASAKKSDFCTLFLIQDNVPFSVEYFYQWVVTHDLDAGVLDEIAAAVSSQEVEQTLDVSVVQMFMSRTIQQHRHDGSPSKTNVASLPLDENDEEGDEL